MTRYTDGSARSGLKDFAIRHRRPSLMQLLLLFLVVLVATIVIIVTIDNKLTIAAILFFGLGVAGWYGILHIQRNRDMMLATEFQNALFASALGINNKFCLIIRRDGNIIYMDRSFQHLFPDFINESRRSVDRLMEQGQVSPEEAEKIFRAIENGVYDKVVFTIVDSKNQRHRIIMSIEPILRPSGFIILRGREFIERTDSKEDAAVKTPLLTKSTITLFSYVMDMMQMGVYMTDPYGNMIYANPLLEQWLGFHEGEIISNNLAVEDIVYQKATANSIPADNYEGEVMLQKKAGGQVKAFINQKVIRDENEKILGFTALVHHLIERSPEDDKKKQW